ncbi:UNVERIFIED_CONTAM: acid phosphatase det1 [Siphonaria sp. JEL0065]|nr:acid phosphatase det1 [Siphonaria sp. JEL0065]
MVGVVPVAHFLSSKLTLKRQRWRNRFEITLTFGAEQIAKDFALFTESFVLVASAKPSALPSSTNLNYPHALAATRFLDDVSLWLVCLRTGAVLDKLLFRDDHILLPHAAGVQISACNNLMSVTSIKNQSIHLFHIQDSGRFVKLRDIGWLNFDDDALVLSLARTTEESYWKEQSSSSFSSSSSSFVSGAEYRLLDSYSSSSSSQGAGGPIRGTDMRRSLRRVGKASILPKVRIHSSAVNGSPENNPSNNDAPDPFAFPAIPMVDRHIPPMPPRRPMECLDDRKSIPLSGIKQRMLAFLYRQALDNGTPAALRHFYMTYDQVSSLIMWRMQFLDNDNILIKFGGIENNAEPPTSQPCFFAIYNLETTLIGGVFDNSSHELLDLFQSWPQFRGTPGVGVGHVNFVTTACNNIHAREFVKKQLYSVRKAKNGGVSQAVKRVLCNLPVNPQLYSESPLLDQSLFSYDESVITNVNR